LQPKLLYCMEEFVALRPSDKAYLCFSVQH